MSKEFNKPSQTLSEHRKNLTAILFWACLFFLCSSDRIFNIPFHGLHFRWGQLLLALAALSSIPLFLSQLQRRPAQPEFPRMIVVAWIPFFAAYGLSAALSSHPALSFTKLLWGLFNILGAAMVIFYRTEKENLSQGFRLAVYTIASILWIDSFYLHWMYSSPLIGFSQIAIDNSGESVFRPEALYYEPSYAGSAMAFAVPLLFTFEDCRKKIIIAFNALAVGSVILIGSRTGILCLALSLSIAVIFGFLKKQREVGKRLLPAVLLSFLCLGLFSFSPGGKRYFNFLTSVLAQPRTIYNNLTSNPAPTSESIRLQGIQKALRDWKDHFWMGAGVVPDAEDPQRHRIPSTLTNTWAELAVESGLWGLLTFGLAVGLNMREALRRNPFGVPLFFIAAAWIGHFAVNLSFTQTFPRLDYWLLFFFSIALLRAAQNKKT